MNGFSESAMARRLLYNVTIEHNRAREQCLPLFEKWGVNLDTSGIFWACCAQFILPWERIQRYPIEFYAEALALATDITTEEQAYGRECWEYVVYAMFKEPALTPYMKHMYLTASRLAWQFDKHSCSQPSHGC